MSYVTIEQVTKGYDNQLVLNNISLTLKKGEFATLLGQSGCGKSTLLRSIAGLEDVDVGRILIDGKDITDLSPRQREVGMVFQSYALFPNMNVFDNIAYGLKMKKVKNLKSKVNNMIDMVDLIGKEESYPHQLSGGQQQRVALARALVMEPKVLLLDEPLSALDAKIRKSLQKELKRIQKELDITTIFVTHDQEEAMTMSDRIFVMNKDKLYNPVLHQKFILLQSIHLLQNLSGIIMSVIWKFSVNLFTPQN
ncbi:ABC transporter ATP-binding protein [Peribacillus frigoritolerans]